MSKGTLRRYTLGSLLKDKSIGEIRKEHNEILNELHENDVKREKILRGFVFRDLLANFLSDEANYAKLDVSESLIKKMKYEIELFLTLEKKNIKQEDVNENDYIKHRVFVNFYRRCYLLPYIIQRLEENPNAFPWSIEECKEFFEISKAKFRLPTKEEQDIFEQIKCIKQMLQTRRESHQAIGEVIGILNQIKQEVSQRIDNSHEDLKQEIDNLLRQFKP